MKEQIEGQVPLSKLIFTHNWEDPSIDERVLKISKGDTVFTITSGGCNTLGFLRFNPSAIYCVDINPAQNYLMELKKAAMHELDYKTFTEFLGLQECRNRIEIYDRLKLRLSREAVSFWNKHTHVIRKGLIMNGRYERFVKIAGAMLRILQGGKRTRSFFELESLADQQAFYNNKWDNKKWRWIFETMLNKKRLAKRGLVSDYFHFDDGSSSFSESFYRRAGHVMKDLPARDNYFLALYLTGKYLNDLAIPEYLKEKNFQLIKANTDRVVPVSQDSKYWLEKQADHVFDAFALSNICELMDDTDTHKLFAEVIRTAKPGARVIFRNLMIPREVPEDLRKVIVKDEELSKSIQYDDRSFVYGKVAAYVIHK
jgi:S-adenosylmethionine-diacylglycerol 3-amino-3-carboxypropyl transferase